MAYSTAPASNMAMVVLSAALMDNQFPSALNVAPSIRMARPEPRDLTLKTVMALLELMGPGYWPRAPFDSPRSGHGAQMKDPMGSVDGRGCRARRATSFRWCSLSVTQPERCARYVLHRSRSAGPRTKETSCEDFRYSSWEQPSCWYQEPRLRPATAPDESRDRLSTSMASCTGRSEHPPICRGPGRRHIASTRSMPALANRMWRLPHPVTWGSMVVGGWCTP